MKKLKVIFIYLGVIILSLIMTVVICAAFLFFYRDGSIFGIHYIKKNEILRARVQGVSIDDIKGVSVIGGNFDINIIENGYNEEVVGAMIDKSFGYTHKSKAQAAISARYEMETGTIVFTITEPQGWLSKKDCYVSIGIPKALYSNGFNVKVESAKGDILVGGKDQMVVNTVDIKSTKGEVTLSNLDIINNLYADIGSGWLLVGKDCVSSSVNGVDVNAKVGSGIVNLTHAENFIVNTVTIQSIKSGKIGILRAYEVVTNGRLDGGGKLEIGTVAELTVSTLDTDIEVGTVGLAGTVSKIEITGHGDVYIHNVCSNMQVIGHNGNIRVGKASAVISLSTNQGDIIVTDAEKNVSINTQYGNASVKFAESAPSYLDGGRYLNATTKNGHIAAYGLQNASVTVREKGRVSLDYDLVLGTNVIESTSIGMIEIVVPYDKGDGNVALNLKVKSAVKPDVELGVVSSKQLEAVEGLYLLEVNNIYGNAYNNTLKVESAAGNIKIRSRDMVNF